MYDHWVKTRDQRLDRKTLTIESDQNSLSNLILLNKSTELISKCWHKNKSISAKFKELISVQSQSHNIKTLPFMFTCWLWTSECHLFLRYSTFQISNHFVNFESFGIQEMMNNISLQVTKHFWIYLLNPLSFGQIFQEIFCMTCRPGSYILEDWVLHPSSF